MPSNAIISAKVTTDLQAEPVSLEAFKDYAHIAYSDDDVQVAATLKAARVLLEKYCQRKFGVVTIAVEFTHSGRPLTLSPGKADAFATLTYRPCRLHPFSDVLEREDEDWELLGGRFEGEPGHYVGTYTTLALSDDDAAQVVAAIKAQALFMWENKVDANKQLVVSPFAIGLIANLRYIC